MFQLGEFLATSCVFAHPSYVPVEEGKGSLDIGGSGRESGGGLDGFWRDFGWFWEREVMKLWDRGEELGDWLESNGFSFTQGWFLGMFGMGKFEDVTPVCGLFSVFLGLSISCIMTRCGRCRWLLFSRRFQNFCN